MSQSSIWLYVYPHWLNSLNRTIIYLSLVYVLGHAIKSLGAIPILGGHMVHTWVISWNEMNHFCSIKQVNAWHIYYRWFFLFLFFLLEMYLHFPASFIAKFWKTMIHCVIHWIQIIYYFIWVFFLLNILGHRILSIKTFLMLKMIRNSTLLNHLCICTLPIL